MPIILRVKGYRIRFYEADLDEPVHVHIEKENKAAKYWLSPIMIARQGRFRPHELAEIERILEEHREKILQVWQQEQTKRANR